MDPSEASGARNEILARASGLLSEQRFWEVIEGSLAPTPDQQEQLLERELDQLTRDEFKGFLGHFWVRHRDAYRNDLWAVAYSVMGGCSDDCFSDFRTWLVARGRAAFREALVNPDSLCSQFQEIPEGEIPLWEYYLHVPYDRRFGSEACNQAYGEYGFGPAELLDPENAWSDEDEASISRLCPAVFEEFWNNDRF